MNNNYIDRWGRIHDKPCTNSEPSSNNAWIYSAYAKKLGIKLKIDPVCFDLCAANYTRHPNDFEPPMSRDEILGMAYLGLGFGIIKITHDWYFHGEKPAPFNLIKLIKELWLSRGHRNNFWKNKYTQVYRFAFGVPLTDRAFILKEIYGEASWYYLLIEWFDKKLKTKSNSSKLIRWLKYDIDPGLETFEEYFGKDHPITIKYKEVYGV